MSVRLFLARLIAGKAYQVIPIPEVSIPSVWIRPSTETGTTTTTFPPNTTTIWINS